MAVIVKPGIALGARSERMSSIFFIGHVEASSVPDGSARCATVKRECRGLAKQQQNTHFGALLSPVELRTISHYQISVEEIDAAWVDPRHSNYYDKQKSYLYVSFAKIHPIKELSNEFNDFRLCTG